MKLTPWFKCWDVRPTIPGWYDVKYEGFYMEKKRYWFDGSTWYRDKGSKTRCSFGNSRVFSDSWRGLAEPPKKAKAK